MMQSKEVIVFEVAGEKPASQPLKYTLCGLDNVYLRNGFTQEDDDGEIYTAVENVEDLHLMIALRLAVLRRRLSGQEMRFLRKYLDLTQEDVGRFFDVTRKTINEYERGAELPRPSQIILQLKVARKLLGELVQQLKADESDGRQIRPNLKAISNWLLDVHEEMKDWLLEIRDESTGPDLPPPFMIKAAIGSWKLKFDGDRHRP